MKLLLILSLLLIVVPSAKAQTNRKPPAKKEAATGATMDGLLEIQKELSRLAEIRADERVKQLEIMLKRVSNQTIDAPIREMLLRARAAIAEAHLKQQRPEAAVAEFKKAFEETTRPISDRVFSVVVAFPAVALRLGYREEAIELMRSFEPAFSDSTARLQQVALFYLNAEVGEDALRVAKRAIELDPKDSRLFQTLAAAQILRLRMDEATEAYQQAVKLDAGDGASYAGLANIYRADGALEEALVLYRKQLEVTPAHESAHGGIALTLLLAKRDAEAAAELAQQISISGRDFRLYTQLAYVYAARSDFKRAKGWAELAIQSAPAYAWARIAMASVLLAEQEYDQAEELLSDALARGSSFPTLYFELVRVLILAENYVGASEQAERFLKINEDGEFEVNLAGMMPARSRELRTLLDTERKAALALPEAIASPQQYRLVEGFLRFNHYLNRMREGTESGQIGRRQRTELQLKAFEALGQILEVADSRRPFRKLWIAEQLLLSDAGIERASDIAAEALAESEAAVRLEGSLRDLPELDQKARLRIFRARTQQLLGRIRLKQNRVQEATELFKSAVEGFEDGAERRDALWQLAVALQTAGREKEALESFIKAYNKYDINASLRRLQIENLYKKLNNGSLEGLRLD